MPAVALILPAEVVILPEPAKLVPPEIAPVRIRLEIFESAPEASRRAVPPVEMPVEPLIVVPVIVEAEVIVPEPAVEILPEVVKASPAVLGLKDAPERCK